MISWIKNWFGVKKYCDIQPVFSKENTGGEYILDSSSSIIIELPQVTRPNYEEDRKPQEYWEIYNKSVSFYNRKLYEKAKGEFLKLLVYENPHNTLYTHLLRTYRKIVSKNIEKQKFQNAYDVYQEFFSVCKDRITDNDLKNCNKLVEKLIQNNPDSGYKKIELVNQEKEPDFKILGTNQHSIALFDEIKTIKENLPKASWNFIEHKGLETIYVKCFYNNELLKYDKALIVLKDERGNTKKEFAVNHGIYRFKASKDSDKFVASSDDMVLYIYNVQGNCHGTYNLKGYSENKYHVRCLDISPESNFLLFTSIDRAYLMDSSFKLLGNWKTPPKEGWELKTDRRISDQDINRYEEYKNYLAFLGLSGNSTNNEIKVAFRNMILKYHPDINPDSKATEKTREIICAYEKLTGEDARQALKGIENVEYYYKLIDEVKIEIPGTTLSFSLEIGMIGSGEDWIYGTYIGSNAERIYLGCYSGKVFCISKNGHVAKQYICHDTIGSIREKGQYLFIETAYCLFILKEDRYINHISTWKAGNLRWNVKGFMFVGEKEIHLFNDDGIEIGKIDFKNKVYDAYWVDSRLNIMTANKTYMFTVFE